MIFATFKRIDPKSLSFSPEVRGCWYVMTCRTIKNRNVVAYLGLKGWQRHAHYFPTNAEAKSTYDKVGQVDMSETDWHNAYQAILQMEAANDSFRRDDETFYRYEGRLFEEES
jgi:hypothetical protein